ncbi:hypothetical protein BGW36DRAFT_360568 [Talaromyces proteolyticus]|uniref:Uncharacterized protein n=1 Tax=Talaromyces proteolyticus TaxID=1131652 RepID=A0AAD4Q080_9EURO|nr:uncharacterized protein BGW36DRAFT_360568 [Talaromyces proteolyticus]KAH8696756.1 hypothetical protein BGW36DRAFT_360568 [Talaromyces proteolyticus]
MSTKFACYNRSTRNAAIITGRTILAASEQVIRSTFDINVFGALSCLKLFLPAMIAANRGHTLVMSSATAFLTVSSVVDNSASKAAVTTIVEGLRTELKHKHGNSHVKLSAYFPGTISTTLFQGIVQPAPDFMLPILHPDEVANRIICPLQRGERYVVTSYIKNEAIGKINMFSGADRISDILAKLLQYQES